MQIVIDIPKDIVEGAKSNPNYYPLYLFEIIWKAIVNSTPLPEHHGRLIDSDVLHDRFNKSCMGDCDCCPLSNDFGCNLIMNADVVLEATEEDDNEDCN